jgi:hypothetical protein
MDFGTWHSASTGVPCVREPLGRQGEKALEKINDKKICINIIGGSNSAFMGLGLSPLAAWAIRGFCCGFSCAARDMEEMTREKAWRASHTAKMINLMRLVSQKAQFLSLPS